MSMRFFFPRSSKDGRQSAKHIPRKEVNSSASPEERLLQFRSDVNNLVKALKNHRKSINSQREAHRELFGHFLRLSEGTPIAPLTGGTRSNSYGCWLEATNEPAYCFDEAYRLLIKHATDWLKRVKSTFYSLMKDHKESKMSVEYVQEEIRRLEARQSRSIKHGKPVPTVVAERLKKKHADLDARKKHLLSQEERLRDFLKNELDAPWKQLTALMIRLLEIHRDEAANGLSATQLLNDALDSFARAAKANAIELISENTNSCNSTGTIERQGKEGASIQSFGTEKCSTFGQGDDCHEVSFTIDHVVRDWLS